MKKLAAILIAAMMCAEIVSPVFSDEVFFEEGTEFAGDESLSDDEEEILFAEEDESLSEEGGEFLFAEDEEDFPEDEAVLEEDASFFEGDGDSFESGEEAASPDGVIPYSDNESILLEEEEVPVGAAADSIVTEAEEIAGDAFIGEDGTYDFAEETEGADTAGSTAVQSGQCGNSMTWSLYDDGSGRYNLVIEGTGNMWSYRMFSYNAPWYDYSGNIYTAELGEGITYIGEDAFRCCSNLTSIKIPESVTSIGLGAFASCINLKSVTIPESVTYIQNETFADCAGLVSVTIPDSVTAIGQSAFRGCSSLKDVTIPAGVTRIEYWSFEYCSSFESITIPDGVTGIEDSAFQGCRSLVNITLPESLTEIGQYAFCDCESLRNIYYRGSETQWNSIFKSSNNNDPLFSAAVHYNFHGSSTDSFTVSFDKNASDATLSEDSKIVVKGEAYGTLPTPIYSGWAFNGWYTAKSGGTKITASSVVELSADQTLYAHWLKKYTITFNKNAEKAVLDKTKKTVTNTRKYGELPIPTYPGYYFEGWYTAKSGGSGITASTVVNLTGKQTLYAHWTLRSSISTASVKTGNAYYDKTPRTPSVTVTLNGKTLKEWTDYTLAFTDNIKVGKKAAVKVTGINRYKGSVSRNFEIKKRPLTSGVISASLSTTSCTYSGKEKKPKVTVTINNSEGTCELVMGTHYTVAYQNNIDAGTASVILTGKGNFTDSKTLKFKINKAKNPVKLSAGTITASTAELDSLINVGIIHPNPIICTLSASSENRDIAFVKSLAYTGVKIKACSPGKTNINLTFGETANYKKTVVSIAVEVEDAFVNTIYLANPEGTPSGTTLAQEYDDSVFFGESTEVSPLLARNSALLAFSTYGYKSLGILRQYGFNDVVKCFTGSNGSKSTSYDNDNCTVYIGWKDIQSPDGREARLFGLAVSGYSPGGYEWVSNFNVGDTDAEYPHMGFYTAENKMYQNYILPYIEAHCGTGDLKFWLAGHSRGGAITNLLAVDLSDRYGMESVYAYGFATPRYTDQSGSFNDYQNIKNYINDDDFVPEVVPEYWGYGRYGHDTFMHGGRDEMKSIFRSLSGEDYGGYDVDGKNRLILAFNSMAPSRFEYNYKVYSITYLNPKTLSYEEETITPRSYCQEGLALAAAGLGGAGYMAASSLSCSPDLGPLEVTEKMCAGGMLTKNIMDSHQMLTYWCWMDVLF